MNDCKKCGKIILKVGITTVIMLVLLAGEYFLFKHKIVPIHDRMLADGKEVRAWIVKMAMCLLPFVVTAFVAYLAYRKKIDKVSYISKCVAVSIAGLAFFAFMLIKIITGAAGIELIENAKEAETAKALLTLTMNIFLRNIIGFAIVAVYFAVRANTGDSNVPASADDCDNDAHSDIIEAD